MLLFAAIFADMLYSLSMLRLGFYIIIHADVSICSMFVLLPCLPARFFMRCRQVLMPWSSLLMLPDVSRAIMIFLCRRLLLILCRHYSPYFALLMLAMPFWCLRLLFDDALLPLMLPRCFAAILSLHAIVVCLICFISMYVRERLYAWYCCAFMLPFCWFFVVCYGATRDGYDERSAWCRCAYIDAQPAERVEPCCALRAAFALRMPDAYGAWCLSALRSTLFVVVIRYFDVLPRYTSPVLICPLSVLFICCASLLLPCLFALCLLLFHAMLFDVSFAPARIISPICSFMILPLLFSPDIIDFSAIFALLSIAADFRWCLFADDMLIFHFAITRFIRHYADLLSLPYADAPYFVCLRYFAVTILCLLLFVVLPLYAARADIVMLTIYALFFMLMMHAAWYVILYFHFPPVLDIRLSCDDEVMPAIDLRWYIDMLSAICWCYFILLMLFSRCSAVMLTVLPIYWYVLSPCVPYAIRQSCPCLSVVFFAPYALLVSPILLTRYWYVRDAEPTAIYADAPRRYTFCFIIVVDAPYFRFRWFRCRHWCLCSLILLFHRSICRCFPFAIDIVIFHAFRFFISAFSCRLIIFRFAKLASWLFFHFSVSCCLLLPFRHFRHYYAFFFFFFTSCFLLFDARYARLRRYVLHFCARYCLLWRRFWLSFFSPLMPDAVDAVWCHYCLLIDAWRLRFDTYTQRKIYIYATRVYFWCFRYYTPMPFAVFFAASLCCFHATCTTRVVCFTRDMRYAIIVYYRLYLMLRLCLLFCRWCCHVLHAHLCHDAHDIIWWYATRCFCSPRHAVAAANVATICYFIYYYCRRSLIYIPCRRRYMPMSLSITWCFFIIYDITPLLPGFIFRAPDAFIFSPYFAYAFTLLMLRYALRVHYRHAIAHAVWYWFRASYYSMFSVTLFMLFCHVCSITLTFSLYFFLPFSRWYFFFPFMLMRYAVFWCLLYRATVLRASPRIHAYCWCWCRVYAVHVDVAAYAFYYLCCLYTFQRAIYAAIVLWSPRHFFLTRTWRYYSYVYCSVSLSRAYWRLLLWRYATIMLLRMLFTILLIARLLITNAMLMRDALFFFIVRVLCAKLSQDVYRRYYAPTISCATRSAIDEAPYYYAYYCHLPWLSAGWCPLLCRHEIFTAYAADMLVFLLLVFSLLIASMFECRCLILRRLRHIAICYAPPPCLRGVSSFWARAYASALSSRTHPTLYAIPALRYGVPAEFLMALLLIFSPATRLSADAICLRYDAEMMPLCHCHTISPLIFDIYMSPRCYMLLLLPILWCSWPYLLCLMTRVRARCLPLPMFAISMPYPYYDVKIHVLLFVLLPLDVCAYSGFSLMRSVAAIRLSCRRCWRRFWCSLFAVLLLILLTLLVCVVIWCYYSYFRRCFAYYALLWCYAEPHTLMLIIPLIRFYLLFDLLLADTLLLFAAAWWLTRYYAPRAYYIRAFTRWCYFHAMPRLWCFIAMFAMLLAFSLDCFAYIALIARLFYLISLATILCHAAFHTILSSSIFSALLLFHFADAAIFMLFSLFLIFVFWYWFLAPLLAIDVFFFWFRHFSCLRFALALMRHCRRHFRYLPPLWCFADTIAMLFFHCCCFFLRFVRYQSFFARFVFITPALRFCCRATTLSFACCYCLCHHADVISCMPLLLCATRRCLRLILPFFFLSHWYFFHIHRARAILLRHFFDYVIRAIASYASRWSFTRAYDAPSFLHLYHDAILPPLMFVLICSYCCRWYWRAMSFYFFWWRATPLCRMLSFCRCHAFAYVYSIMLFSTLRAPRYGVSRFMIIIDYIHAYYMRPLHVSPRVDIFVWLFHLLTLSFTFMRDMSLLTYYHTLFYAILCYFYAPLFDVYVCLLCLWCSMRHTLCAPPTCRAAMPREPASSIPGYLFLERAFSPCCPLIISRRWCHFEPAFTIFRPLAHMRSPPPLIRYCSCSPPYAPTYWGSAYCCLYAHYYFTFHIPRCFCLFIMPLAAAFFIDAYYICFIAAFNILFFDFAALLYALFPPCFSPTFLPLLLPCLLFLLFIVRYSAAVSFCCCYVDARYACFARRCLFLCLCLLMTCSMLRHMLVYAYFRASLSVAWYCFSFASLFATLSLFALIRAMLRYALILSRAYADMICCLMPMPLMLLLAALRCYLLRHMRALTRPRWYVALSHAACYLRYARYVFYVYYYDAICLSPDRHAMFLDYYTLLLSPAAMHAWYAIDCSCALKMFRSMRAGDRCIFLTLYMLPDAAIPCRAPRLCRCSSVTRQRKDAPSPRCHAPVCASPLCPRMRAPRHGMSQRIVDMLYAIRCFTFCYDMQCRGAERVYDIYAAFVVREQRDDAHVCVLYAYARWHAMLIWWRYESVLCFAWCLSVTPSWCFLITTLAHDADILLWLCWYWWRRFWYVAPFAW